MIHDRIHCTDTANSSASAIPLTRTAAHVKKAAFLLLLYVFYHCLSPPHFFSFFCVIHIVSYGFLALLLRKWDVDKQINTDFLFDWFLFSYLANIVEIMGEKIIGYLNLKKVQRMESIKNDIVCCCCCCRRCYWWKKCGTGQMNISITHDIQCNIFLCSASLFSILIPVLFRSNSRCITSSYDRKLYTISQQSIQF